MSPRSREDTRSGRGGPLGKRSREIGGSVAKEDSANSDTQYLIFSCLSIDFSLKFLQFGQ
jgi:hypothetical protein